MKLEKQEWKKLQTPLITLGLTIAITALLFTLAQTYSNTQEEALKNQQNQLNSARQRYQSSGAEKDMITEFLPKYQALINKGFIGEERRIEWVEELRVQHKSLKLFDIKYNIGPQEDYKPIFASNLGGFVLHRSIMKLELDMLHEGDILQLTESLSAKNITPFMLRDCEITRPNSSAALNKQLIANMHALCELDWLTLREPTNGQATVNP